MKKIGFPFFAFFLMFPLFVQSTSVTVIAPNGGENWIIGCPNTIQWITAANVPVKIELYKNNLFYLTICSQVPAGQNTYSWTPPSSIIPGSTFKVKITCLTNSAGYDFSNGYFTISPGTITVVSPNGGEFWQYGTTHLILWTDNICDNVRIELWKGGAYYSLITSSTPSNGSFSWALTNTIAPGNDYKIKIISTAIYSNSANTVFDFSDTNFTIGGNGIIVLVPNGGEFWYTGGTYSISWIDNVSENARIELWKGGVLQYLISPSALSPYSWTITAATVPGNDYKIKVMAQTNTSKFDFSDDNFTISNAYFITVTSPNGGEIWARGSTHLITWQDNIPWNVRIELWKSGVYNSLINASTPSIGSCNWAIPATLPSGNDYKVKILALNSNTSTLYDFSDNYFTISISGISSPAVYKFAGNETKIYPNPCNNSLHLDPGDPSILPVSVTIMNVAGKMALRQDIVESSNAEGIILNTSGLADGYYIFVIRKGSEPIFRTALVVQH